MGMERKEDVVEEGTLDDGTESGVRLPKTPVERVCQSKGRVWVKRLRYLNDSAGRALEGESRTRRALTTISVP